jgi:uncharacterized membrane protein
MHITRRYHRYPLLVGLLALSSSVSAVTYQVVDQLPGDTQMYVRFASKNGETVVGYTTSSRIAVWSSSTGTEELMLPGDTSSNPRAVSADGSAVVGTSYSIEHGNRAFVWTPTGGIQVIAPLPGFNESYGESVSADGSTVVGASNTSGVGTRAFIWTAAEGLAPIDPLPGDDVTYATHVSADGSHVAGQSSVYAGGGTRGFAWSATDGAQAIDPLPGDTSLYVDGISADGSVVIGESYGGPGGYNTIIWSAATGTLKLEAPSGVTQVTPRFISADGSTVAGYLVGGGYGQTAWVWTAQEGMQILLLPGATGSIPDDLSSDGTTVVGESYGSGGSVLGFIWTAATGVQAVEPIDGYDGSYVLAVSADGSMATGAYYRGPFGNDGNLGFRWRRTGTVDTFPQLQGEGHSWGEKISADGSKVTGSSCTLTSSSCQVVVYTWETAPPNQVATPPGADVVVQPLVILPGAADPVEVELTFGSVQSGGTTTVTVSDTPTGGVPESPSNFKIGAPPIYYDVDTTATFSGQIDLCFSWQEGQFDNEGNIALFHFVDGAWQNVTTSLDVAANKVCGAVGSLSPFALFETSYSFAGFFPPVDSQPTVNVVSAGAAVPLKFSLGGNQGLSILAAGYPSSKAIACDASAPSDTLTETLAASASGLKYDAATNTYTYVWKTDKAWARTCRRLTMKLIDGSIESADFQFKK